MTCVLVNTIAASAAWDIHSIQIHIRDVGVRMADMSFMQIPKLAGDVGRETVHMC